VLSWILTASKVLDAYIFILFSFFRFEKASTSILGALLNTLEDSENGRSNTDEKPMNALWVGEVRCALLKLAGIGGHSEAVRMTPNSTETAVDENA
jgi:hypothetical protein